MYELWQVSGDTPLFLLKKNNDFEVIYKEYMQVSKTISCSIVHTDSQKTTFIYESPDNGKTIYRRKFGDTSNRVKINREEIN